MYGSMNASDSRFEDTNPEDGQQLENGHHVRLDKQSSSPEKSHCESRLNALPQQQQQKDVEHVDVQKKESLADWGLVACVFISNFISSLESCAFAVLYPYLVEHFEATTAAVGWCASVSAFFESFVALFASYPIQSYGCRVTAVVGCLLLSIGFSLTYFAPNLIMIYFTYGVIAGTGSGLALLPSNIIIYQRLSRNRNLASGIGSLGYGFGGIVGSIFANHLIQTYGWRGTFLVLGALQAQRIPLSLFFRTPKTLTTQSKNTSGTNHGKIPGQMILRYLKGSFNFSILRQASYSVYAVAYFLSMFCMSGYWPHTVNRALNVGLSRGQGVAAATLISIMATVARLLVAVITNLPKVNSSLVFATGMFLAFLSIVAIYIDPGIIGTMTSAGLFGLYLGSTTTVFSVVAVDLMGVALVPKSLAVLQFIGGFAKLVAAPLIGWVYDETRDYNKAFAIVGCMAFVSGSLMIVLAFVTICNRNFIPQNIETPLSDNDTAKPQASKG